MPNKETSRSHSKSQKQNPKKMSKEIIETGEFEISGSEHLGKDSEESDFEITGRESLIPKKERNRNKSKH